MRTHGGNLKSRAQSLDFSANINPLGMPESVREAVMLSADECAHYPDPECTELVRALAEYEQFPASRTVCGNGAADLIFRIVSALRPRRALLYAPAFSEYSYALRRSGCEVITHLLREEDQFVLRPVFLDSLSCQPDIIFVCTPNNPTGKLIEPEILEALSAYCRTRNTVLVCDECFIRFCADAAAFSLRQFMNGSCIILQAFTKLYAMPGLRLGYALCGSERLADLLRTAGQYWSVSVPAQAAGLAALRESDWVEKTVSYAAAERGFLTGALRECGITVYDGDANFLLLKAAADFADDLEQYGIFIRRCSDFDGLSGQHFRIAVRTHEENAALIAAVREVCK